MLEEELKIKKSPTRLEAGPHGVLVKYSFRGDIAIFVWLLFQTNLANQKSF